MLGKEYKGFPYLRFSFLYISCLLVFHYLHDKISPEKSLRENCNCGTISANPFEQDEDMDREDRHPWFVRVFSLDRQTNVTKSCGGSLVSSRHVVTAAHCLLDKNIIPMDKSNIHVKFKPEKSSLFRSKAPKFVQISNFSIHEDYSRHWGREGLVDGRAGFYDIALIELEEEVNLRVYTPICLPNINQPQGYSEKLAEVLTFKEKHVGDYRSNENYEEITKKVFVKESCVYPFSKIGGNVDHLCAWGYSGMILLAK